MFIKSLKQPLFVSLSIGFFLLTNVSCAQKTEEPQEIASSHDSISKKKFTNSKHDQTNLNLSSIHPISIEGNPESNSVVPSFKEIEDLVGLSCESNNHCKVIGVGHSPCGGHARYLVYSETNSEVDNLKNKVAVFNGMQKLKQQKQGMVGICRYIEAPKPFCVANRCEASVVGPKSQLN
ncbi:MAG: hypothetical protein KUG78_03635 [Kangiellaceae bacterium]|nr:hypothetical protein [Kangiellaceae bacterium]